MLIGTFALGIPPGTEPHGKLMGFPFLVCVARAGGVGPHVSYLRSQALHRVWTFPMLFSLTRTVNVIVLFWSTVEHSHLAGRSTK